MNSPLSEHEQLWSRYRREDMSQPPQHEVGDDVTVVDSGKTFMGKVGAKNSDGTVTVSFAGQRPNRDKFKPNEVSAQKPAGATAGKPATATTASTPASPGLVRPSFGTVNVPTPA